MIIQKRLDGRKMNLIRVATSGSGPYLGLSPYRVLPRRPAYRFGEAIVSHLARQREIPFVRGLRANMAVVHGLPEDHPEVDRAVTHLLCNMVRGYVDLFQVLAAGREKLYAACELASSAEDIVEEYTANGRGLVLVGAHMCSFDISLLRLGKVVPHVQLLSKSAPGGGSRLVNDIRAAHGILVTPISIPALRQAVKRLRRGGIVAIAADIPNGSGEGLTFFGHESRLPVGHARLALGTGAGMLVCVSHRVDEGSYQVEVAPVPRPKPVGDRKQDVVQWAQDSLSVLEDFIRRWPEEWLMPTPVWSGGGGVEADSSPRVGSVRVLRGDGRVLA